MTVNEIYEKTKALLGEKAVGIDCTEEAPIKRDALKMLDMILSDLNISEKPENFDDVINCSKNEEQALIYGLAMLICTAFGMQSRQQFFASLYSGHRTASKSKHDTVRDVLPKGEIQ